MKSDTNYQQNANSGEESSPEINELEHLRKIFVGGLHASTTEQTLKDFYSQFGNVVDTIVMRDQQKKSRCFGFVTFSKATMVDDAQQNRPHVIDGKQVETKRSLPRSELNNADANASVRKIFVGGLKDNHDEECLREHFSAFGNVIGIKIITDKATGRKRGFGYVEFDDYDAVDKAVFSQPHTLKYVVVDVKKSVYKKQDQQNYQNDQSQGQNPRGPPQNWGPNNYSQPPPNWGGNNYNQPPPNWNNWGPYWGWNQSNWCPPPNSGWTWNQQSGWVQSGPPQPGAPPSDDKAPDNYSGPNNYQSPPNSYGPNPSNPFSGNSPNSYQQPPNYPNTYPNAGPPGSGPQGKNWGGGYNQNFNAGPGAMKNNYTNNRNAPYTTSKPYNNDPSRNNQNAQRPNNPRKF